MPMACGLARPGMVTYASPARRPTATTTRPADEATSQTIASARTVRKRFDDYLSNISD
jgi:hypothetical protein